MILKCLIIDDEPLARKVIQEYIEDTDFLEFTGETENAVKAVSILAQKNIDLIFLDIQMPKINGVKFLKANKHLPGVIFTTAFPEYALEGYELDVIDYLVKPILYDRFLKAAIKAKDYFELKLRASNQQLPEGIDYIFIKSDSKLEKIFLDDILFIEALSNYIVIHSRERKFITYLTMRNIEDRLPATKFIQVHRSYIVAISKITKLETNDLWIADITIPVSKSFKDQLLLVISDKIIKRL